MYVSLWMCVSLQDFLLSHTIFLCPGWHFKHYRISCLNRQHGRNTSSMVWCFWFVIFWFMLLIFFSSFYLLCGGMGGQGSSAPFLLFLFPPPPICNTIPSFWLISFDKRRQSTVCIQRTNKWHIASIMSWWIKEENEILLSGISGRLFELVLLVIICSCVTLVDVKMCMVCRGQASYSLSRRTSPTAAPSCWT